MIKVNRKMSWEEVKDTYGGLLILISDIKREETECGVLPVEAYVHFVIENDEDRKVAAPLVRNTDEYMLCKPDLSRRRAQEHPELVYVEVV